MWKNSRRVGFITSGGYGHSVAKSLGLALVDRDVLDSESTFEVDVVGSRVGAIVINESPWDPHGSRMRN